MWLSKPQWDFSVAFVVQAVTRHPSLPPSVLIVEVVVALTLVRASLPFMVRELVGSVLRTHCYLLQQPFHYLSSRPSALRVPLLPPGPWP
ncbi:hypothetical protein GALMADRAFT_1244281 [Galerina marginata CBS 339.88]|uniref:Uncharacterized protein n=1 Tax=Galerina marginata (strain CBS 339.88) TaxID=685588 RepID=A0A067TI13_GALM3|nr:hypothetical protein GALMADRAFT_1244281 [Galerina marginata CBS 339.88]